MPLRLKHVRQSICWRNIEYQKPPHGKRVLVLCPEGSYEREEDNIQFARWHSGLLRFRVEGTVRRFKIQFWMHRPKIPIPSDAPPRPRQKAK